jgi:hypothetical protein
VDSRFTTGTYFSAGGHLALIVWLLTGWGLSHEPLPFEVTEVSVVSGEEYAAIVAATTPNPSTELDAAPEPPAPEETPAIPEQDTPPEIAPAPDEAPTPPEAVAAPPPPPPPPNPPPPPTSPMRPPISHCRTPRHRRPR